ncbi:putative ATP-dependent RNA helicase DDX10 [Holothuria leucospilota]|uniref:ATP-dependent RNA helicase n=1 Tax=Holothuria leucospilota TaxID=206669 RepID=A0A9Q1HEV0_HOLLE|nr:putative ATP-dependent RNA helicase DDX10 [Holothuria leucospilota]
MLAKSNLQQPTEIQKASIGLALQGCDILGVAKTGSGKTLAFLIPMLECLFQDRWTAEDGLGVVIISPTRELAYQTFEVLYKIGKQHEFSAGLVIGRKDRVDITMPSARQSAGIFIAVGTSHGLNLLLQIKSTSFVVNKS